jgi:hypothetical protein
LFPQARVKKVVGIGTDKFNRLFWLGKKIPGPFRIGVANEDSGIGSFCARLDRADRVER